jgi:type IV pilus assembly protein PilE
MKRRPRPRLAGAAAGFTLVELLAAMAVAVLLGTLALPSFADHWRQARRSDATVALIRLQMAQEQFRAHHGIYAANLSQLRGASSARSDAGWYDIALAAVQPQSYEAVALARADGSQGGDSACAQITLRVFDGMAETGPQARCWNR